jgi:hypothetical protein
MRENDSVNRQCEYCKWFWGPVGNCHNYASKEEKEGKVYCPLFEEKGERFNQNLLDDDEND